MRLPVIDHLGCSLIAQGVCTLPLVTFIEGKSMEEKSRGGKRCEQRTGINQKHEICTHSVTWWCGLRGSTQVTDSSPR